MTHIKLTSMKTTPLHTANTEPSHAGVAVSRTDFPTTIIANLAINRSLSSLQRFFLTKNKSGAITMHCALPFEDVGKSNLDNRTTISKTIVFVAVNANANEYNTKDEKTIVISNNTPHLVDTALDPKSPYNGVNIVGCPATILVPKSLEEWNKAVKDGSQTYGQAFNSRLISYYNEIDRILGKIDSLQKEVGIDEEELTMLNNQINIIWDNYVNLEQSYHNNSKLVESSVIYVNANQFTPVITCFQNTTSSSNQFLDAGKLYGNEHASYAPQTMFISGLGHITASDTNIHSGYNYGLYSLASKADNMIVVPEEDKPKTLESCVREIAVKDSSGRISNLQLSMTDKKYGDKIVKHSANLNSVQPGTSVNFTGDLLTRRRAKGSLAIDFRISSPIWHGNSSTTSSNEVNAHYDVAAVSDDDLFESLSKSATEETKVVEEVAKEVNTEKDELSTENF